MDFFLNDKILDNNFGLDSEVFTRFLHDLSEKKEKNPQFAGLFDDNYERWKEFFLILYSSKNLTKDLFSKHLYCVILIKGILHSIDPSVNFAQIFPELGNLPYYAWFIDFSSDVLINITNLSPFNKNSSDQDSSDQNSLDQNSSDQNSSDQNPKTNRVFGDLFHIFYQKLVSANIRHNLGEFYTPPELASNMITETYKFGQKVMDPACGTGIFLLEILRTIINDNQSSLSEKIGAVQKIFGFDINPLACALARLNIILALEFSEIDYPWHEIHIFHESVLFWENKYFSLNDIIHQFDLIVGNPAWITIKNMQHLNYKAKVKNLAVQLGFKPKPHQIPNIEISALFLFQCREFLKTNGSIALVVSNAFITGSNHATTRTFPELDNIRIWSFDFDIFSVPHICIFAKYSPGLIRSENELKTLEIENVEFKAQKENEVWKFRLKTREYLIPSRIEHQNGRFLVQKLIKKAEKFTLQSLLPHGNNPYYNLSHRGADIFPRSLLSVLPVYDPSGKFAIVPQGKESKANWDFNLDTFLTKYPNIYNSGYIYVEPRYIFPVLKSKHLIPFTFTHYDYAFIPIEMVDNSHCYQKIQDEKSNGWCYYQALERIFQEHHKSGAAIRSLWERVNYHNNLTNPRHLSPIKVVYQRSGSYVKASLLLDSHVIVDTTNYFLELSSLDEAYYVMGFLNAPDLTKAIRIEKSARDIHKLPFTFFLPLFEPHNPLHQKLVSHTQKMERDAKIIAEEEIRAILNKRNSSLKIGGYYNLNVLNQLKTRRLQTKIYLKLGWNVKKNQITEDFEILNRLIRLIISEIR